MPSTMPTSKPSMPRLLLLLALLTAHCSLLTGCQSPPATNQVQRLLSHPQFPQARAAAPEWARDALTTINDLQTENQKLKAAP